MSSTNQIYTGLWINHSRSTLLGATLTLTDRNAAFLLALLAIVVATAGHSFWRILSFTIHQLRSRRGPNDAIFYQQQAVLKNSGSALDATWKFTRLSWAWRKHSKWYAFGRNHNFLFVVAGMVTTAVFATAAIFSSQVTKSAGTAVLIDSKGCGFWAFDSDTNEGVWGWDLKTLNDSFKAANYANTCYGTGNGNGALCSTYISPEIPWTRNQNASCPFADNVCLWGTTAAYEMDTGPLDSHDVLGLDSIASERVTIRKVATCAPVMMKQYSTLKNVTLGPYVDEYLQFDIGAMSEVNGNWTYEYDLHAALVDIGYDLQTINAAAGYEGAWIPIPDLNRTDADIAMFFLAANGVGYIYPNADPLFRAEIQYNFTYGADNTLVYEYSNNFYVSSLGCADQFQVCNPAKLDTDGNPLCTPLGSSGAIPSEAEKIGLNTMQYATVETIVISLRASNMFYSVSGRGASALKAQSTVFTLTQVGQLPDNQWQIELDGWFATSLASLQVYLYDKAVGPSDVLTNGGVVNGPTDASSQALCQRQMIRNVSGYQNFSTLGVAIILVLGCFLVVLGWIVDIVVGWIQRLFFKRNFARLGWLSDGYLQLQRMAYEGAGYERWQNAQDDIPIAVAGGERMQLGGLEVEDEEHPMLMRRGMPLQSPSPRYQSGPVYHANQMYEGMPVYYGNEVHPGTPMEPMKQGLLAHQTPVYPDY